MMDLTTHTSAHDAAHDPHLAHHFDTMEQQHEAVKLGMWLFLITEILLFGGLFVAYAIYRSMHPEVFRQASHLLDWKLGCFNTAVLIGSSLTMALAVRGAQLAQRKQQIIFLAITLLLAAVFLCVKYVEYSHKFHLGLLPGKYFEPHDAYANIPHARTFFSIYFLMTGLHGFHVLGGMAVIAWMLLRARRNEFSAAYYYPVELTGLYWHLVDLIWIYLFPLLYLIR